MIFAVVITLVLLLCLAVVGAIAKDQLGSANAYMKIFEANKDQLTDPDKIKPGQVLRIP